MVVDDNRMRWWHGFVWVLLLGALEGAMSGTVLTIITPGPQSHLFGMRKVTMEMAGKGHKVAVRFMCPDLVTVDECGSLSHSPPLREWLMGHDPFC